MNFIGKAYLVGERNKLLDKYKKQSENFGFAMNGQSLSAFTGQRLCNKTMVWPYLSKTVIRLELLCYLCNW